MPGSMRLFRKYRKRDINLEIPIVNGEIREMTFYTFNDSALNTFDPGLAKQRDGNGIFKMIKKYNLNAYPLAEILNKYLPKDIEQGKREIDFMSIDVEGYDFDVLQSNDWNKYKPKIILIESLKTAINLQQVEKDVIALYLKDRGYDLVAKTYNTLFFKLK